MPGTYTPTKDSDSKSSGTPSSTSADPSSSQPAISPNQQDSSTPSRRATAKRFFSAYAQTWLGLAPLWLMGEALLPNSKFGAQFSKGRKNLASAAEEVRELVATSGRDVVVIVDEKILKLKEGGKGGKAGEVAERTAEVLKAAGENAILVVTSSFDKLSAQLSSKDKNKDKRSSTSTIHDFAKQHSPALKNALHKHGRDALVLLDKSLKHPVVITGVSGFARTRGIPHADALLRLASLGLNRILRSIPEVVVSEEVKQDIEEAVEAHIEEIEEMDAEELERRSTQEEREEAESVGRVAERAPDPPLEGQQGQGDDPYTEMKKRNECVVM